MSTKLTGQLVRAGTMTVEGEEITGYVVSCTRDQLRALVRVHMYEQVEISRLAERDQERAAFQLLRTQRDQLERELDEARKKMKAAQAAADGLTLTFTNWQNQAITLAREFPGVDWSHVNDFVPHVKQLRADLATALESETSAHKMACQARLDSDHAERLLSEMTADRDSWCEQNDNRVTDFLEFAKLADEWKASARALAAELVRVGGKRDDLCALAAFEKLNANKP